MTVEEISQLSVADDWDLTPPKCTNDKYSSKKPLFLSMVCRGLDNTKACKKLNIPILQVVNWKYRDPKFRMNYARALDAYSDISLDRLKDRAIEMALSNTLEKAKIAGLALQNLYKHHNYKRALIPKLAKDYSGMGTKEKLNDVDRRLEAGVIEPKEALTEKEALSQNNKIVTDETLLKLEKLLKSFEERDAGNQVDAKG